MSITDELRLFAADPYTGWVPTDKQQADLRAMADRIDAEHKAACAEAYGNGVESVALPDMTAYVKLPVDADGVPIRVGDVLDGYGKTIEVVDMRCGRSGWVLISRDGNGYADTFAFTHHHEPTVEDVLWELLGAIRPDMEDDEAVPIVAAYAKRLHIADEVKEQ